MPSISRIGDMRSDFSKLSDTGCGSLGSESRAAENRPLGAPADCQIPMRNSRTSSIPSPAERPEIALPATASARTRNSSVSTLYSFLTPDDAEAFDSYDVFVDSKKFTSCRVSFAVAIHLAGFVTLYSVSNPSSSSRRSARYFTYWLM